MTDFETRALSREVFLVEGSMYDRLMRSAGTRFDSELAHLGLIDSDEGRSALRIAYQDYINVAASHHLPLVVFTPTWRANQERVSRSSMRGRDVNGEAVSFLLQLRNEQESKDHIFIGGLIGCKNDCYVPQLALSSEAAEEFHMPQIAALARSDVDFLFASTLPALSEAVGIARAFAKTDKPYVLSFVTGPYGWTLDGVLLSDAFRAIDSCVSRKPLGYFVNCCHPVGFSSGLKGLGDGAHRVFDRLLGFQGNTSRRDPREFESLAELETEAPTDFAQATIRLREAIGLSMLGGCCGTGPEHIDAIGRHLANGAKQL